MLSQLRGSQRLGAWVTLVAVTSLVVILLMGGSALQHREAAAASAGMAPNMPGAISGRVTNTEGVALSGIEVHLIRHSDGALLRFTMTDVDGRYVFHALGVGTYYLKFSDRTTRYGTMYSGNVITPMDYEPLLIAGTVLSDVNVSLSFAAILTGTVHSESGGIYHGVTLWVKAADGSFVIADSSGDERLMDEVRPYTFHGLAPGIYRPCAFIEGLNDVIHCYGENFNPHSTSDITVTSASRIDNVNIVADESTQRARIVGTVLTSGDQPLSGIQVRLMAQLSNEWVDTRITTTDWDGRYYLGNLAPGLYTIAFLDSTARYQSTYYGNVATLEQAKVIEVAVGEERVALKTILTPFAQIAGTVLIQNVTPPFYAELTLLQENGSDWQQLAYARSDALSGHYYFPTLKGGRYRIKVASDIGYGRYITFYGGKTLEDATTITVAESEQVEVNINLGEGEFNSRITGKVVEGITPVSNIKVALIRGGDTRSLIAEQLTDDTGSYEFGGLYNGSYLLFFTDPQQRFATLHYNGVRPGSGDEPTPIVIGQNMSYNSAATSLIRGGSIVGNVRNSQGAPLENVEVKVYERHLSAWLSAYPSVTTDHNGDYAVHALWPGTYRLEFTKAESEQWMTEYYGSEKFLDQATNVTVQGGSVTSGIDLIFGPDTVVYMPVVAGNP